MAAPKPSAQVNDLTTDLDSFMAPRQPEPYSASPGNLAELQRLLENFVQDGALRQQADGSYTMAHHVDPRQERVDRLGSDCDCPRCTPYNQLHWWCAGCLQGPYEWSIVQPKGAPITILGQHGVSESKKWEFCTPDCGQKYRTRQALRHPDRLVVHTGGGAGNVNDLPVAGGDDGYGDLVGR